MQATQQLSLAAGNHAIGAISMNDHCPYCRSSVVTTRNLAKKIGALVGTIGGATGVIPCALGHAQNAAVMRAVAEIAPSVAIGGKGGSILGLLAGAATGCITGARIGQMIDESVLANYRCRTCGHSFSSRH